MKTNLPYCYVIKINDDAITTSDTLAEAEELFLKNAVYHKTGILSLHEVYIKCIDEKLLRQTNLNLGQSHERTRS